VDLTAFAPALPLVVQAGLSKVRLAMRNVVRQRGRSASAAAAVAFGVVSVLLASGFIESILRGMREATIESHLGHIQVRSQKAEGAGPEGGSERHLLSDDLPLLQLIDGHPGVLTAGRRIRFSGLLSISDNTVSYVGEGVEPEREVQLSASLQLVHGENLSPAEPRGVILGAGLAANIGAHVGDTVVLMATTASGGVNAVECRVRGLFTTVSKAYDDAALRVPLAAAQELLKVDGFHSLVILLKDTDSTAAVLESLRSDPAGQGLTFTPWYELADMYNKTAVLFRKQLGVLKAIVAAIIVLSISNTMMRVIMERTGEVGTAMALGLRRRGVLAMFVVEGLILGLIGGLLGLALGAGLAWAISAVGIPMPPPPGMARGYTAQIAVSATLAAEALLLALATALAASVYPAWKASRLPIVDALRHNR